MRSHFIQCASIYASGVHVHARIFVVVHYYTMSLTLKFQIITHFWNHLFSMYLYIFTFM